MKRILSFFAFFCMLMFGFGQTYSITGKILNAKKQPLDNATVYLLKQKDSSIINYTSSGKEGGFHLKVNEVKEPAIFRVEVGKYAGYEKKLDKIAADLAFDNILLEELKMADIEGVVVSAAPVKIKKDTIEFKASALKVRPDSKIEELLKEIPGVEISNEGKITVNGKEVDQVLINGKPFFDKDGKIALKNLPADIIKNIQFTTTKTKEEELSGKSAKSNNATINFNIDEKKNKGFLSRLSVGYGSDKRYESSLLASYFKGDTKISLLGSANNINSQGFSNDEVFDSMGYGRNSWLMQGGSVVRDGGSTYFTMNSRSNKGILKSEVLGLNYSDKISKEVSLETLGLMHLKNNLTTQSKVKRTTLLPDYTLITQSEDNGTNDNQQFAFDNAMRIKPDSLTSIYFSPGFTVSKVQNINSGKSATFKDGTLLNENSNFNNQESLQQEFNPNIYFTRKFKNNKRRQISANISNRISQADDKTLNISNTSFFEGAGSTDNRNQFSKRKNATNNIRFGLTYDEPILDSATVSVGLDYSFRNNKNQFDVNDFDTNTGGYTAFNALLSNVMRQEVSEIIPNLGFEVEKKKLNLWMGINFRFTTLDTKSNFQNQEFSLTTHQLLPNYYVGMQYTMKENLRLNVYNNASYTTPTAVQLSPFVDQYNPLVSVTGNPDLKASWNNNVGLYLNNSVIPKNINYYLNLNFNYSNNSIVNTVSYDDNGKQWMSYDNVSGNKSVYFGLGFTKSYKWNDNKDKFTIDPQLTVNHNFNKGFINNQLFSSKINSLSPRLNLTYEIKDRLTVKPSYALSYSKSKYENYVLDQANYTSHRLKLELTNYFFNSNFVIGNDVEYNTNSFIAPGFKRNYYFWNTSVGYSFFDKQLTAKVKVYDVLNQNQSISKNITASYIEDREDLILKRYIMFSLSMKLNKFAGKK